ncbi:MAG: sulfotransferase domain-containing protein [Bacteroidota bacterium]
MKIDFIICGVMKSGTTTLANDLLLHPNIAIPEWEVRFFIDEAKFEKGYNWYEAEVDKYASPITLMRGEKSQYSYRPYITHRLFDYNPALKLIFILRNPIDRAWSNYTHDLWNMDEWRSFERCLKEEENRPLMFQYLSKGRYIEQIENYLEFFPLEQMHFILFEDFIKNWESNLRSLFNFLNVPEEVYDFSQRTHAKRSRHPKYPPMLLHLAKNTMGKKSRLTNFLWKVNFENSTQKRMKERTKLDLHQFYKPYNQRLVDLLKIDLGIWEP